MNDTELQYFRQSGKIARKVREESKSLIMVGESLLDIAETVEQMIIQEGGKPAFPVNISLNEIAAHFTPELEADLTLADEDIVKIDLGVEVNGGLADTAYTVDLSGKYETLVKAAEDALENGIKTIKPGIAVGEVGGVIEDTIKKYGYKPISNLAGHMMKPYELHAGIDIPNIRNNDPYQFAEGDVFAVEPFATTGAGFVEDLDQVEIFSLYVPAPVKMRQSRKIAEHVIKNFGTLPFAERWVRKEFNSRLLVSAALREMLQNHLLRGYPALRESSKGLVTQFEHTIIVTSDGCDVTTK